MSGVFNITQVVVLWGPLVTVYFTFITVELWTLPILSIYVYRVVLRTKREYFCKRYEWNCSSKGECVCYEVGNQYIKMILLNSITCDHNIITAVTHPSSQGTRFHSGSVGVSRVVDNVTVWRLLLVCIVQRCLMLVCTCILFVPVGQFGQAWNFQRAMLCHMSGIIG
jgi:hypothetical protein